METLFPKGDFLSINICYLFMEIPSMRKLCCTEISEILFVLRVAFQIQCIHQLENTLKDANNDLARVLKGNFKREDVLKSHTIIQMSLDCKRVLESILEDLEAKKRKL